MIVGIGIDSVEIKRFNNWTEKSTQQLNRIFCDQEIDYILANRAKSAERCAVRFAAKEAFSKALAQALPGITIPLPHICRHVSVTKQSTGALTLHINWHALLVNYCQKAVSFAPLISLTHTETTATAVVVLQKFSSLHN